MRIVISAVCAISVLITLTACNTVAGIGEDITGSAHWVKNEITSKPVDLGPRSGDTQTQSETSK